MTSIRLIFIPIIFFTLLCESKESPGAAELSDVFAISDSNLTLETVILNWDKTVLKVSSGKPFSSQNWRTDLQDICMNEDNLCESRVKKFKKNSSMNKKIVTEIKTEIEAKNFEALKYYTIEYSLKFLSKLKNSQLMTYADILLTDNSCLALDMRHALASSLEDSLPDQVVREKIIGLYEKNSLCSNSKTTTLSSYRAAMFRLLENDCQKALPNLEKVTNSTEEYLKPRSLYWTWKCASKEKNEKSDLSKLIPFFSYHRILIDSLENNKNETTLSDKNETSLVTETNINSNLNLVARLAENLIAHNMTAAAKSVLEKIRTEKVQETEPEFQIYWAHLLNVTYSGIKKFQILSAIINTYPQFRSRTIQNMLFPTSYFEQVEALSKKIDPWLVQSLIRQESAFDPRARSSVGATGLMQLMPATARRILKTRGQLRDPVYNVNAGIKFLEFLVNKFDGEIYLALAAYNAGPMRVTEWQKRYETDDPILFVDAIPYRETREYVAFILRNYYWYRSLNPALSGSAAKIDSEPPPLDPNSPLARMAMDYNEF